MAQNTKTQTPLLWCKACGASTALIEKTTHERNCRAGPVTWTQINPHKMTRRELAAHRSAPHPAASVTHLSDMANTPHLANGMANNHTADVANEAGKAPGRNRSSTTYRYRNPDRRRLYMRELMRQRRATGRATAA